MTQHTLYRTRRRKAVKNIKQPITWGMVWWLLTYDGFVNLSAFIETLTGSIPFIGDIFTMLLNAAGGLLLAFIFIMTIGRRLWWNSYLLTVVVGILSPFLSVLFPLTTGVFIIEHGILFKGKKKGS